MRMIANKIITLTSNRVLRPTDKLKNVGLDKVELRFGFHLTSKVIAITTTSAITSSA